VSFRGTSQFPRTRSPATLSADAHPPFGGTCQPGNGFASPRYDRDRIIPRARFRWRDAAPVEQLFASIHVQGAMPIPPVHNETPPRAADCPRRTGAALLEVLVGLIVAAILLTPLARSVAAAMHHYTVAASRDRGSALQAYALGKLRADPCGPSTSGDTTAHGTQVSWSAAADANGARELRATLNTLGDDLEVVGSDVCR
jgi:hypothetical protein